MSEAFLGGRIETVQGDITTLEADGIVNAANESLLGGGGVDGAIHRAAGPELLETCKKLGGAATGEAKATPGFRLPARMVIHTVGPVWSGGGRGEPALLASCYSQSLQLAEEHRLQSVAFPSISTGAYGYPIREAAAIALRETQAFLSQHPLPSLVIFCCFSSADLEVYRQVAQSILEAAAS